MKKPGRFPPGLLHFRTQSIVIERRVELSP